MTRLDRAALVLALEVLRRGDDSACGTARQVLLQGDLVAHDLWLWAPSRWDRRVFRVRLALALRVLLRADAGDFGRRRSVRCERCEGAITVFDDGPHCAWCDGHGAVSTSRLAPLWEQAPPHAAAHTPPFLQS